MERTKYIDIHSLTYIPSERSKLVTQILKVMLEAITATTFVMLDRLFYEALDVVRQFALEPLSQYEGQDIEIKVIWSWLVANTGLNLDIYFFNLYKKSFDKNVFMYYFLQRKNRESGTWESSVKTLCSH